MRRPSRRQLVNSFFSLYMAFMLVSVSFSQWSRHSSEAWLEQLFEAGGAPAAATACDSNGVEGPCDFAKISEGRTVSDVDCDGLIFNFTSRWDCDVHFSDGGRLHVHTRGWRAPSALCFLEHPGG